MFFRRYIYLGDFQNGIVIYLRLRKKAHQKEDLVLWQTHKWGFCPIRGSIEHRNQKRYPPRYFRFGRDHQLDVVLQRIQNEKHNLIINVHGRMSSDTECIYIKKELRINPN